MTGQSFAWRLRRVRNEVRWWRRRTARRALRWIQLHPEVRRAARDGRMLQLLRETASRRRTRSSGGGTARSGYYRSIVTAEHVVRVGDDVAAIGQVDLRTSDGPELTIDRLADGAVLATGPAGEHRCLPPVDARRWSPDMFQYRPTKPAADFNALPEGDEPRAVQARRLAANRAASVHVTPDDRGSVVERARRIAELAVAATPISGRLDPDVRSLVGADVADLIEQVDRDLLGGDDARREAFAVVLQRTASQRHAGRGWWATMADATGASIRTTPSVSVLLPSNRPDDVVDAARQVGSQLGVDVQLVVGLHGSHMPATIDDAIRSVPVADVVVHRIGDDANLGQVMNQLTERADGALVSKWDDDDWYDVWHLDDLVRALESSAADLVGKAAEFVYLEALDLTIRRFEGGAHRPSTTIAGGTLMMLRDELAEIGWDDVPRQVDRRLIEAVEARGGRSYRTHGLGYVLRRRGAGTHTWVAADEYFLVQSTDQHPGLALEFAGFATAAPAAGRTDG